ncbi:MAG: GNAT family N-acetyltransferase [Deltaproteobacteria bacterium]|nr:GNAT family N-acetyltransferase [Deltaproteobacteria bacterium]
MISRKETQAMIRPIEEKDRDAVRNLIDGTGAFKPFEVDVAMELVDIALTSPDQEDYHPFVLEEEDGTVAAYACFGKNPMTKFTFDLYWLATRADRMGKGYGRKIVSFVEEEVRKRGGKLLVIETSSKESYGTTREFYIRIGCTLAAQLPDYYDDGDDKLIYLKRIT